jgi:hypothetical protein
VNVPHLALSERSGTFAARHLRERPTACAERKVRDVRRGSYSAQMRPRLVPPVFIAGVFAVTTLSLIACGSSGSSVSQSDRDKAVDQAQAAYRQFIGTGQPTGSGPCIAENVPGLPDWVVDIAHNPRLPIDDEPANQCQRYRDGEAHHFVELEPNGALIRAE